MIDLCEVIELEVIFDEPEIELELDFEGEYISGSDGQDYKRGYDEGHAQGLIDGQADGYKNGYDEGHKVGYESGHTQGKQEGLTEGYDNGYSKGKADGYQAGYDEGYSKGYSEGYEQGKAEATKEEQEKSVTITENGTTEILPDLNKLLSRVSVDVNVKSNGLPYDMGEFVLDADSQNGFYINHNLGEVPEVFVVWTDDFADLTEENISPYSTTTNLGFIWLRGLTGMSQRLASTVTSENGIVINGYLSNDDYRATFAAPISTAYMPYSLTSTQIHTPKIGNNYFWRAGVKYKYFVAKAWWNNGGAVNVE